MGPTLPYIQAFANREIIFRFRNRAYRFFLSHGLFSSADIDTGSRLLLKVLSWDLDQAGAAGRTLPRFVLDAGSGAGVLGVCLAGALPDAEVRCQDRDELARVFTEHNARHNNIPACRLSAHTEPLLAGPSASPVNTSAGAFDLIVTNIPAKAGPPVLEDFVQRSVTMLRPGGRVFMVAVNPLADFFRSRVREDAALLAEEAGQGHTVFVYAAPEQTMDAAPAALVLDEHFPQNYPFYIRNKNSYELEGIHYRLDTVYGAADFDEPGGAIQAAARLAVKFKLREKLLSMKPLENAAPLSLEQASGPRILIRDDAGQGHFGLWLNHYLVEAALLSGTSFFQTGRITLSGRNILGLAAARSALVTDTKKPDKVSAIPAVDLLLDQDRLAFHGPFTFTGYFPESVSGANRIEADWQGLERLMAPNGILIAAMGSSEAEAFDRKKTRGFNRLMDLKRAGFRALAYQAERSI